MVSRLKSKWYKLKRNEKLVLRSQLQTYQILTNKSRSLEQSCYSFILAVYSYQFSATFFVLNREKFLVTPLIVNCLYTYEHRVLYTQCSVVKPPVFVVCAM